MAKDSKISNLFSEMFPKHPHRRIHILFSLLVMVVVAASVFSHKMHTVIDVNVPIVNKDPTMENLEAIKAGALKNISNVETLKLLKQIDAANVARLNSKK